MGAPSLLRRLRSLEGLMLALLALSLLIHALTIWRLLSIRTTLRSELDQLAVSAQTAKAVQLRYDLPIDQRIPVDLAVPIHETLAVPIRTTVQIKQDITLPVDTGFGRLDIPVPVDAEIPISTTVPVEFARTINISTTVPLRLTLPVQLDLGTEQFSQYLDRLHDALIELRDQL